MATAENHSYLSTKYNQFRNTYQEQKKNFSKSQQYRYYIVSVQYLKNYQQYCKTGNQQLLQNLNYDIVDAGGNIKKNLQQQIDYQIINQKLFKMIYNNSGHVIYKRAVIIDGQKIVPFHSKKLQYILVSQQYLQKKNYEISPIRQIQTHQYQTAKNLNQQIVRMNKRSDSDQGQEESISVRLWKYQTNMQIKQLFDKIKQKYKQNNMNTFCSKKYPISIQGKVLKQSQTIQQLLNEQNLVLIAQLIRGKQQFIFKHSNDAKCQSCYLFRPLTVICGCKQVKYCNQECRQKDQKYHLKSCSYHQQKQLTQQINMIFSSNSRRGLVGLNNLGNTCFMNSCLQCLSNCQKLTKYFLNNYYKKQINFDNVLGSGGKLVLNYAKFIQHMWCGTKDSFNPSSLKNAVSRINPIFSGYQQHDSQQFFSFLVDGIHQDLNRIIKKPYVQSVDSNGRPDKQVALQSWIAYTKRNQSIIVDLFTGQYKSKVICPQCKVQSITFDPFTTVSLPIPQQPSVQQLKFFQISENNKCQAKKHTLQFMSNNTNQQIIQKSIELVQGQINPNSHLLYVLTISQDIYGFENCSKSQVMNKIKNQNKIVFLLQLSKKQKQIKQDSRLYLTTMFAKQARFSKQFQNIWFKRPFIVDKNNSTILDYIQLINDYLFPVYKGKIDEKQFRKNPLFNIVVKYNKKLIAKNYTRKQTTFQKQMQINKQNYNKTFFSIYKQIQRQINSNDVQFDIRFDQKILGDFDFDRFRTFNQAKNQLKYSSNSNTRSNKQVVQLSQCFRLFEQKQQLQKGNQWYCPKCKVHQLASKQISIYKAPQILILHLKRFKTRGTHLRKQKNQALVNFGQIIDLKQYVVDSSPMSSYNQQLKKIQVYQQPKGFSYQNIQNNNAKYQLFAVSNHFGGLGGGHYTAYGKNEGRWYQFNDSNVRQVQIQRVISSGAYMLFYRRI